MSDYAAIPGVGVITCEQAVKFRNGELLQKFDALSRNYDQGREHRIRLLQEEFRKNMGSIKKAWETSEGNLRRRVAANAIGVALSVGGLATGKWIASKGSLSPAERTVSQDLVNRGTTFISNAISAKMINSVDVTGLVLLPAATIVTIIAFPAVSGVVTAVGIGVGVLGLGDSLVDYFLGNEVYNSTYAQFEQSLKKLAQKSVVTQLEDVIRIKNQIDLKCG